MKPWHTALLLLLLPALGTFGENVPPVATYSIVAHNPKTGEVGVAVQSKFFGVGSVVPWVDSSAGAVATQSYANTTLGPDGLQLMKEGRSAEEALGELLKKDTNREQRQVAFIDLKGGMAVFTGSKCHDWAGHLKGTNFTVQGNILAGKEVVEGMKKAFETRFNSGEHELSACLLAALEAAEAAGGDRRGRQSAAMVVCRAGSGYAGLNDRFIDLRVEDHPDPVTELGRLLKLHGQFYRRAHQAIHRSLEGQ